MPRSGSSTSCQLIFQSIFLRSSFWLGLQTKIFSSMKMVLLRKGMVRLQNLQPKLQPYGLTSSSFQGQLMVFHLLRIGRTSSLKFGLILQLFSLMWWGLSLHLLQLSYPFKALQLLLLVLLRPSPPLRRLSSGLTPSGLRLLPPPTSSFSRRSALLPLGLDSLLLIGRSYCLEFFRGEDYKP